MSSLVENIIHHLQNTLSPVPQTREAGEEGLKIMTMEGCRRDGGTGGAEDVCNILLQLAIADTSSLPAGVPLASAIYLKNRINKYYDPYESSGGDSNNPNNIAISPEQKTLIRQRLLESFAFYLKGKHNVTPIHIQLEAAIAKIIRADYPEKWPTLPEQLLGLLAQCQPSSTEQSSLLTIFQTLLGWHGAGQKEEDRDVLASKIFPSLFHILSSEIPQLLSSPSSPLIVKEIFKCFHCAIQYKFSPYLLGDMAQFSNWCTAFMTVLQSPSNDNANGGVNGFEKNNNNDDDDDDDDISQRPLWKAKKWSLKIMNKIFLRYGFTKLDSYNAPPSDSKDGSSSSSVFPKLFMDHVSSPLIQAYMDILLKEKNLPKRHYSLLIDALEGAVRSKNLWTQLIMPNLSPLLSEILLPTLSFSDKDDVAVWEESGEHGEDWIRLRLSPWDEGSSGSRRSASINLILDLIRCRRRHTFIPILSIVNERLMDASLKIKDGALFLLGSISRQMMAKKKGEAEAMIRGQVEGLLMQHILPLITGSASDKTDIPSMIIRARAAWVIEQFGGDGLLLWSQSSITPLISTLLEGVISGANATPVRMSCASALAACLSGDEKCQPLLREGGGGDLLPRLMESLLGLANLIQLDSISMVLESLVQIYSQELAPFAVQLCVQLRDTLMRQLESYDSLMGKGASSEDSSELFNGIAGDRMMSVVGMLTTIGTLVDSMTESSTTTTGKENHQSTASTSSKIGKEGLELMEQALVPLCRMIMERKIIDVYEEMIELLESLTWARKAIGPAMWSLFPLLHQLFCELGPDYLNDMQCLLENYISYGKADLINDAGADSTPNSSNPSSSNTNFAILLDIINRILSGSDDNASFGEYENSYAFKLMITYLLEVQTVEGGSESIIKNGTLHHFIKWVLPFVVSGATNAANSTNDDDVASVSPPPLLSTTVLSLSVLLGSFYVAPLESVQIIHSEGGDHLLSVVVERLSLAIKEDKFKRLQDKRMVIVGLSSLMRIIPALPEQLCGPSVVSAITFSILHSTSTIPKAQEERARRLKEQEDDDAYDYDGSDYDGDGDGDEDEIYKEIGDDEGDDVNGAGSGGSAINNRSSYDDYDDYSDYGDDFEDDELDEELYSETPIDSFNYEEIVKGTMKGFFSDQSKLASLNGANLLSQPLMNLLGQILQ